MKIHKQVALEHLKMALFFLELADKSIERNNGDLWTDEEFEEISRVHSKLETLLLASFQPIAKQFNKQLK